MTSYIRLNPASTTSSPGASMFDSLEPGVSVSSAVCDQYGNIMSVEMVLSIPSIPAHTRIKPLGQLKTGYRPASAVPFGNAHIHGMLFSDGRIYVTNSMDAAVSAGFERFGAIYIRA